MRVFSHLARVSSPPALRVDEMYIEWQIVAAVEISHGPSSFSRLREHQSFRVAEKEMGYKDDTRAPRASITRVSFAFDGQLVRCLSCFRFGVTPSARRATERERFDPEYRDDTLGRNFKACDRRQIAYNQIPRMCSRSSRLDEKETNTDYWLSLALTYVLFLKYISCLFSTQSGCRQLSWK